MRIGLVLYGHLASTSGGFLYDRYLVDALRRAGDTVDVIPLPWRSYAASLALGLDPRLAFRLRAWNGDLLLQDELAHPSLARINRSLRRDRANPPGRGANPPGRGANPPGRGANPPGRGANPPGRGALPIVSIVHHLRISERPTAARALQRRIERAYLESVDGFIFNSATTRTVVQDLLGRAADGVVATPGGDRLTPRLTEEAIAARSRCPGALRVLFAGNFIPRKGLHVLIEALAMLPRGSCRLTAAGARSADPGYSRRIDRLVAARGLEEQVCFPGHLDDAALAAALAEHHVLAVPSSYEGFGIVYLEAMGFGVVPLASNAGGGGEIVEHGRSGFLVAPDDARSIADALRSLAADRGRIEVMAREARARYGTFPGWEGSMARAVTFLHSFRRS